MASRSSSSPRRVRESLSSRRGSVRYERTKGSLHFPIDQPLPAAILTKLVDARLRELGL